MAKINDSTSYDVLIVGAGMAGLSLVHLLRHSIEQGLKVALVERVELPAVSEPLTNDFEQAPPSFDGRATALSFGTQQIFAQLGVWPNLAAAACPIHSIQVSDQGRFGQTHLHRKEAGVDALGYIIRNHSLGQGLMADLPAGVDILAPESVKSIAISAENKAQLQLESGKQIMAELVVMADGGRSDLAQQLGIRQQKNSYGTHALVTSVRIDRHHEHWAYERFTDAGPIALLPLAEKEFAVVWTLNDDQIEEYLAADDATLIARLQQAFGYRSGRIVAMGERACYPLALVQATEQVRPHIVLLGNAAHSLHPVAGQGFNLGLRDAAALAQYINQAFAEQLPVGAWPVVQGYYQQQKADQNTTILGSDVLPKLFGIKNKLISIGRDAGLIALALSPTSRKLFARQAMGMGQPAAKLQQSVRSHNASASMGQTS